MKENEIEENMPVESETNLGKITIGKKAESFKERHPKLVKGLKYGGIGLLLALFGVGGYKLGSNKTTDNGNNDEENGNYYIDLDKLEDDENTNE